MGMRADLKVGVLVGAWALCAAGAWAKGPHLTRLNYEFEALKKAIIQSMPLGLDHMDLEGRRFLSKPFFWYTAAKKYEDRTLSLVPAPLNAPKVYVAHVHIVSRTPPYTIVVEVYEQKLKKNQYKTGRKVLYLAQSLSDKIVLRLKALSQETFSAR